MIYPWEEGVRRANDRVGARDAGLGVGVAADDVSTME